MTYSDHKEIFIGDKYPDTNLITIHFFNSIVYFHDVRAGWITVEIKKETYS